MERKYKFIICGKMYDGIHDELFENQKILVEDDKIAALGTDVPCPEEAEVIDLSNLPSHLE